MRFSRAVPAEYARYLEQETERILRTITEDRRHRAGDPFFAKLPNLISNTEIDVELVGQESYVVVTDAIPLTSNTPMRTRVASATPEIHPHTADKESAASSQPARRSDGTSAVGLRGPHPSSSFQKMA